MIITARKIKPYFNLLLFALIIAILVSAGFFFYENFYQTIARTEKILILRKGLIFEMVNLPRAKEALEKFKQKKEGPKTYQEIKNPFK